MIRHAYGYKYSGLVDFIQTHDIAILICIGFAIAFAWTYANKGI